eukprot:6299605-Amphidinium_carterae.1
MVFGLAHNMGRAHVGSLATQPTIFQAHEGLSTQWPWCTHLLSQLELAFFYPIVADLWEEAL